MEDNQFILNNKQGEIARADVLLILCYFVKIHSEKKLDYKLRQITHFLLIQMFAAL